MTYAEFKDMLITHLWKMGDSVVINALDDLIRLAETELDRDLQTERRAVATTLAATSTSIDLPVDCRSIIQLKSLDTGAYTYITPSAYADRRTLGLVDSRDYTVIGSKIQLMTGGSVEVPVSLRLWYYQKVPVFKSTAESWLCEEFFDVYLYTVLKHTAPFLREDERVQLWDALAKAALISVAEENEHNIKLASAPLKIRFKRGIS